MSQILNIIPDNYSITKPYGDGTLSQTKAVLRQNVVPKNKYIIESVSITFQRKHDQSLDSGGYFCGIYRVDDKKTWYLVENFSGQTSTPENVICSVSGSLNNLLTDWLNGGDTTFGLKFGADRTESVTYDNIRVAVTYRAITSPSNVIVDNVDVGTVQTATITNEDQSVKHKVTWSYGTVQSGEMPSQGYYTFEGSTCQATWSIPSQNIGYVYQLQTNSTTVSGTITVRTYTNEEEYVGETQETIRLTIPDSQDTKPEINLNQTEIAYSRDEYPSIAGQQINFQNHSSVTIEPVFTAKYGAQIASMNAVYNNVSYAITAGSHITIPLTKANENIFLYAVDSRGFQGQYVIQPDVVAYTDPQIISVAVNRYDEENERIDDEGSALLIQLTDITDSNAKPRTQEGVDHSYEISVSEKTNQTITRNGNNVRIVVERNGGFKADESYSIVAVLYDGYGNSTSISTQLGTAIYTIYRLAGGKGIAFGTAATKYGAEVSPSWPFYTHGKEIMHLILDLAHPVSSVIQTFDAAFDPNAEWPWQHWGKIENASSIASVPVTVWVRLQ